MGCGASLPEDARKMRCIVIGAGYIGIAAAKQLEKCVQVLDRSTRSIQMSARGGCGPVSPIQARAGHLVRSWNVDITYVPL